jgi:hypothetical protein
MSCIDQQRRFALRHSCLIATHSHQVTIMPSSQLSLDPEPDPVTSHVCPKCLGQMSLIYVKPALIGFEVRTFAGLNCDHVDQVVAETESRKWRSSGLRAPV